jgi:hypothetical protein
MVTRTPPRLADRDTAHVPDPEDIFIAAVLEALTIHFEPPFGCPFLPSQRGIGDRFGSSHRGDDVEKIVLYTHLLFFVDHLVLFVILIVLPLHLIFMEERRDFFLDVEADQIVAEFVGDVSVALLCFGQRRFDFGDREEFLPRSGKGKLGAQFVSFEEIIGKIEDFLRCAAAFDRSGGLCTQDTRFCCF